MQNLVPPSTRPARHHPHKPNGSAGEALCPYCGRPVSRKEFKEIRARIETEERARFAEIEKTLKQRFARERQQAAVAAQQAVEKAKKDATAQIEKTKREAATREAKIRQEAVEAATAALAPKIAEAVNAEKQRTFAEKLSLEQQLTDLQRRLQAKPAHQIGEPAEVELHAALAAAFPADRITRVGKGVRGADVVMEIIHGDEVVGKIVLDSKSHKRWSNAFIGKIRADQRMAGGAFAILSSSGAFPKEARATRLHIQDGVIVAAPTMIVAIVQLLRRQIVEMHRLKLTVASRDEKGQRLLDFIASPESADLFEKLRTATEALIALEVREIDQHHGVWRRRGELIRDAQRVHEDLTTAIDGIIGASHGAQQ